MSWADLRILQEQGHVIGAHSASHRLNNEMDEPALHYELVDAKKRIEENLGIRVNVFASPNNTLFSVNKKCADLIKQHYSFHHITVPGSLADDRQSLMIYRRNIEVYWKKGAILYALGHWDLKRWRSAQSQIAALLR
jgi:peptidoglycan/xylan/chitin deacetylase (PgdA/CDA1 family)